MSSAVGIQSDAGVRSLTVLLPRAQTGAPDRDAYLALPGTLGGLVGLALASSGGGAG